MIRGRLNVITGPMTSGKSDRLITILRASENMKFKTFAFKSKKDTRSPVNFLKSRTGEQWPCCDIENIGEIKSIIGKYFLDNNIEVTQEIISNIVVGIDEASLFFFEDEGKHIIKEIETLLRSGVTIYMSVLNQSYLGTPFGCAGDIMAIADDIEILKAICNCCRKHWSATKSFKITDSSSLVDVGDTDKYVAMCPQCWQEEMKKRGRI